MIKRFDFGNSLFSFFQEFEKLDRTICKMSNLYSGQPRVLTILMTGDGVTLKELANLCHIGMPSLSVSVRNMEKTGLVNKVVDSNDSRVCRIYLTELGRERGQTFHNTIDAYFKDIMDTFGETDSIYLYDTLNKLHNITRNYNERL